MAKMDRWQGLHWRSSLLHSLVATILIVFLFVSCFSNIVYSICVKSGNAWSLTKEKKGKKNPASVPERYFFSTVFFFGTVFSILIPYAK